MDQLGDLRADLRNLVWIGVLAARELRVPPAGGVAARPAGARVAPAAVFAVLYDTEGSVYVTASASGEVLRIEMVSATYRLVSCGRDTVVVFDATDLAAINVTVMLLLPPLLQPCTVLLAAGSDTAMFVNSMASSSAPSPNAILASLVEQQAQGVQFDLGGLRVLASSVSHFSFAFNYKINFTIAGPAGADSAVSAPHGSCRLCVCACSY